MMKLKNLLLSGLVVISIASQAQIPNQLVAEWKEGTVLLSNPSVSINPDETQQIVIGTSGNRIFSTTDGGKTWSANSSLSPKESQTVSSIYFDAKGNLYRFQEINAQGRGGGTFNIVFQEAPGIGKPWGKESLLVEDSPQDHRGAFVVITQKKSDLHAVWTQFDKYGLDDPNAQSTIMHSMSSNGGSKWSKPRQISQTPGDCKDGDNTTRGASIGVGSDGRLFVTWANQGLIFIDRSYTEGDTWLSTDLAVTKQPVGWQFKVPGVQNVAGWPVLKVDVSPRKSNGSLYIVFSDQRNGENDTDIWFTRSTNRGDLWTAPHRVNLDPPGKHQFSPSMAFDPVNGNIFIAYFDRRDHDDLKTDVYVAGSTDGGNTFREFKISEIPFEAEEKVFQGNNLSLTVYGGTMVVAWIRTDAGKPSLWTSIFKTEELNKK